MLNQPRPIPDWVKKFSYIAVFLGVIVFVWSCFFEEPRRVGLAYLTPFVYFLFIALGSLFFVSIQHVSHAGWSVNVRRIFEAISSYLPWSILLLIPLVYFGNFLYEWYHPEHFEHDPILKKKEPYLNLPFFIVRLLVFFAGWLFFYKKLVSFSLKQDRDGKVLWTDKAVKYSVWFLLFFVPSFSLLSVDLLMSLDSHWFSTIFGVYTFAGAFQSALAVIILLTIYFMPHSKGKINNNHLHDLGKFLMGMTLFWAYIAFSQYMLIWYANLPEETTFYVPRSKGSWAIVSIALIVFKFVVPFICLLPRWVKRNIKTMAVLSSLILIMQYVDLYWLIYPAFYPEVSWGWLDAVFLLGFAGGFIGLVFLFFTKHPPMTVSDPREHESSSHHVTY